MFALHTKVQQVLKIQNEFSEKENNYYFCEPENKMAGCSAAR